MVKSVLPEEGWRPKVSTEAESKDFNFALLSKLAWMVASGRDSVCMRLLRSKYKVRRDWLRKAPCKTASPTWRAIKNAKKWFVVWCLLRCGGWEIN